MVTLDAASDQILVAKSFALDQRGSYPSKLISRVFDSRHGQLHEEIRSFDVNVNPCPINDFSHPDPSVLGTKNYVVGDSGFSFVYGDFVQDLACGYTVEEVLTGDKPDSNLLVYSKDTNQFNVIRTEDLGYVKIYLMQVTAKITVPNDLLTPPVATTEVTASIQLEFVVENPCLKSVLDASTVNNMFTTVLAPAKLQDLTS